MKIVNSIMPTGDVEALAANGQKLRVAVTKTSAQGKAAQSATPNLMSFSTDENSVWFNGKRFGVISLGGSFLTLTTSSNASTITTALNGFTKEQWEDAFNRGFIAVVKGEAPSIGMIYYYGSGGKKYLSISLISIDYSSLTTVDIEVGGSDENYKCTQVVTNSLLVESRIVNALNNTSTTSVLSAAMGKKLQDEKLAKTDVVNNLTTTDTSKALSAAQGKALNDRINGFGSPYKVKGTKTNISDVLSLTDAKVGDVWNVTNEFMLGGKKYPAGTNVVCVTATSSSDHNDDNWDTLGGTVDLAPYLTKSDASNTYAKKADTDTGFDEVWEQLGVVVAKDEIVNNLTSSETNKPLSAAQGKVLDDKISALGSVYRIKGSKTNISEVLDLTDAKVGDAWNITNAFAFGGKPYPANTNVVCITATSTSDHDENNWDPIGGTVDLSPYAKKSDISYTTNLPDSLVVPQTIGGISKGTKVSDLEGSTISQMFDNLLFPEVQPTIQAPSATIYFKDTFNPNGIYEVGTTAPIAANFNTSFNRGTCTVVGQANKNRAGNLDSGNSFIYYGGNTSTKTLPAKVTLGTMQYNYHAAYAQGDTLITSKGNKASVTPNPLLAGSVNSSNLTIFGAYPYYCNGQSASSSSGDSNFPTSATPDTKLPLYKWTDTLVGAKFASEAATGTRMQFMYSNRKEVTKVEFYNSISGKWETFGTSNYNAKSGTKTYSVQGTNETYNILTTTGSLSGSVQYRFTMTNA